MTGWSQPAALAAASAHEDRKFGLKEAVDREARESARPRVGLKPILPFNKSYLSETSSASSHDDRVSERQEEEESKDVSVVHTVARSDQKEDRALGVVTHYGEVSSATSTVGKTWDTDFVLHLLSEFEPLN